MPAVVSAAPAADDEDVDELARQPGLVASYFVGQEPQPRFVTQDGTPAFRLQAGETPDARLPSQGWRVEWKGVLEVRVPGEYSTLGDRGGGDLQMKVAGQPALAIKPGQNDMVEGPEIELGFGLQPVDIRFTPAGARS